MAKVRVAAVVPGSVTEAEALWYDLARWPAFMDGFATVSRLQGEWPREGATLAWDSVPAGRGRVLETVTQYEPGTGQTLTVEDERLSGTQRVEFRPEGDDGTRVTFSLDYVLKGANFFTPIFDNLFVRRPVRLSLLRTLSKFARERRADAELT